MEDMIQELYTEDWGDQGSMVISYIEYQNNAMKKGFHYEEEKDRFVCIQGEAFRDS